MNVFLTFDIEVWCNGWERLDEVFPAAFDRYIYGRSKHGNYALPKTLEILQRHGLRGVFFVEPLFSARFGARYLAEVVQLIEAARQDVQLHLHPEWTDEISPPPLEHIPGKRQHLIQYSLDEQTALIRFGKALLEAATGRPVQAFRAGSYAANAHTFAALRRNGIRVDSSLNQVFAEVSGGGLSFPSAPQPWIPQAIDGVTTYPVTVFQDGRGRLRPAQVGACSFAEMRDALMDAQRCGCEHFVIVSHNFEMLKPDTSERDLVVMRRFERLCAFLAQNPDKFQVTGYPPAALASAAAARRPRVSLGATVQRFAEQALRRVL